MATVRKHEYMHEYPFVCTQGGTRQMTEEEHKEALAYHMDVVNNTLELEDKAYRAIVAIGGFTIGVIVAIVKFIMFIA